jgi:uncharacterized delta-60 repeat protein
MRRQTRTRLLLTPLEDRWTPAAGDLDPTFGTGGSFRLAPVAVPEGSAVFEVNVLSALPDGRAVLAGRTRTLPPSDFPNGPFVPPIVGPTRLVRVTADGKADPTFGTNGQVDLPAPVSGTPTTVLARPDGSVLVASITAGSARVLTRLLPDGRVDAAFGPSDPALQQYGAGTVGLVGLSNDQALALAVRPDGRILVAGATGQSQFALGSFNPAAAQSFEVLQFLPNGQPDLGSAPPARPQ